MSNNQSQESTIYDLHTTGLGSLFRVREVLPKPGRRGSPFWACNVKAIHGDKNSPVCVPFDVSIVGTRALEVVKRLQHHANDRDTHVVIGFKIGDMYPNSYHITKGDRNGQLANVLKGRLLQVRWAKVDGEMVYREMWDADKEEFVGEFVDGFDDQPADDPASADDRAASRSKDRAPASRNSGNRSDDRRGGSNRGTSRNESRREFHEADDDEIPY
ncbi:hypothetical protein JOE11_005344 [Robbsia andropogonis]|uniref:DUF3577 domain-containing protein n=1 Tax=Robbsia andropogonis TaxID=28092 RepID=UPI003D24656D